MTKRLRVFAGPNGSGKSTLLRLVQSMGISMGVYVNADDLQETLVRTGKIDFTTYTDKADYQGFRLFHKQHSQVAGFTIFPFDSNGNNKHLLLKFVCTDDPQINCERIANRTALGGHDVPKDKVVSRYYRAVNFLKEALRSSNRAYVFDSTLSANNNDGFEGVKLIFEYNDSKPTRLYNAPPDEKHKKYLHNCPIEYDDHIRIIANKVPMWFVRAMQGDDCENKIEN